MGNETRRVDALKGEGEIKVVIKRRVRRDCEECGEPATKRLTFCYVNGRRNTASSMYGRDDCTYCFDAEVFACNDCERRVERSMCPDGMNWGSTFTANERTAHLFLRWDEREASADELAAMSLEVTP